MKPPTTPADSTLLPHGVMPLYQIRTPCPRVKSWLEVISRGELSAQQLMAAFRPTALLAEAQRGPTIGRKRRARGRIKAAR